MSQVSWEDTVASLQAFQRAVQKVKSLDLESEQGKQQLAELKPDLDVLHNIWAWAHTASLSEAVLEVSRADFVATLNAVLQGRAEPDQFLFELSWFQDKLQALLKTVAPAQFAFEGFKVKNLLRVSGAKLDVILGSIRELIALFKKRGVTEALYRGVKEIDIVKSTEFAGMYSWMTGTIGVSVTNIDNTSDELRKWLLSVFVHEFGHLVEMHFIRREAEEFWNSTWSEVEEKRAYPLKISVEELNRFFKLLEKANFDPSKAARSLKPMDKLKFAYWLRNPERGNPIITPKQFRLTEHGTNLFAPFADPFRYYRGCDMTEDQVREDQARALKLTKDILGVSSPVTLTRDQVFKLDPAIVTQNDEEVEALLTELGVPTQYGKTDKGEDFAETFMYFMLSPEKLAPNALYRMKRTLALSDLYGKSVMRLAHRVVSKYRAASQRSELMLTAKYVEQIIQGLNQGDAPDAFRRLQRLANDLRNGTVDPFPVSELAAYLQERAVSNDEIELALSVRVRAIKAPKEISLSDAIIQFGKETGSSVVLSSALENNPEAGKSVLTYLSAYKKLKPGAKKVWNQAVKKVRFGSPRGNEEASWSGGAMMHLAVPTSIDVSGLVGIMTHELGHAFEEAHHIDSWKAPWGQAPFISDYAEMKPNVEDIAESFAAFFDKPAELRRKCPAKYEALKALL